MFMITSRNSSSTFSVTISVDGSILHVLFRVCLYAVLLLFEGIQTSGFECYDSKRDASTEYCVNEKNFMLYVNKKSFSESHGTKKSFKYCISKVTNETKEKKDEVICLSGSKESGKEVKNLVEQPKREEFICSFIYLRFIFN